MIRIWTVAILLCLPSIYFIWPVTNLNTLGQLCGLVGLTLFSFNLILGSRFPTIEHFFGPLDIIYKNHHLLGLTATVTLLAHPLLMALYIPSHALQLLLPSWQEPTKDLGILALLSLLVLIGLSIRRTIPYELWHLTHKFMGVVLFVGAVHGLTFMSIPLQTYFMLLCFVALTLYGYHTLFGRLLVRRYAYTVTSVHPISQVTEISFAPTQQPLPHRFPGQFAFFTFSDETHPFSLTSIPGSSMLSISAKNSGDFTSHLPTLKTGTPVLIEGPYGRFSHLAHPRKHQIWIAGGIGITPFLSMARSLSTTDYTINLFYCTKDASEAIYITELQKNKFITTTPYYSDLSGRMTADKIVALVPDFKSCAIFICGPLPFMQSLRSQFNHLGVPHSRIITEEFALG